MAKNILLGVTGGIAAYKVVNVASALTKKDYNVDTVMTEAATEFVTPLTFRTVTQNPVNTDMFSPPENYNVKHVSLADKADLVIVAPASANFISKMANGIADDLLSTLMVATRALKFIFPSMNINMYNNPVIKENMEKLNKREDFKIVSPDSGYLACGYEGKGRLPDPEIIEEYAIKNLTDNKFENYNFLITAGPTREPLDPVRFISNYSSGKMGYALSKIASYQGGKVELISGPTDLDIPPGVNVADVETGREMNEKVQNTVINKDIIIMTAAVSDLRPKQIEKDKIKKDKFEFKIDLTSNPDILKKIGQNKNDNQFLVGFAAETENIIKNSKRKLKEKNLDMIIANDISKPDIGFASNDNQVVIITENYKKFLPKMSKEKIAKIILNEIFQNL